MTVPALPPAGRPPPATSAEPGAMRHAAQLADACANAIGPVGVLARALVGITLLALALLWRDADSQDAALGLVAMPAVIVGALAARARRWPQPLRASGTLAHALNAAVIIALFALPASAGGAFLSTEPRCSWRPPDDKAAAK